MLYARQYDLKPNSLKFTSTSRHRGNDCQALTGGFSRVLYCIRLPVAEHSRPRGRLGAEIGHEVFALGARRAAGEQPGVDCAPAERLEWVAFILHAHAGWPTFGGYGLKRGLTQE